MLGTKKPPHIMKIPSTINPTYISKKKGEVFKFPLQEIQLS